MLNNCTDENQGIEISREKIVKLWKSNEKKAIRVIKNGGVLKEVFDPNIDKQKPEDYFKAKFQGKKEDLSSVLNDFPDSDIIIPEFACEEIEISLFDTLAGSAPSKDGSTYEDIKKSWNEKKEEIRDIFNVIRYYKCAQRGWKHGLVCRIPKKNFDSNDLSTLRDFP